MHPTMSRQIMHTPCVKPDGDTARETARVHPKSRTRPTSAQVKNTLRRARLTCCQFWGNPVSPRGLPPSLLCPRFFRLFSSPAKQFALVQMAAFVEHLSSFVQTVVGSVHDEPSFVQT